MIWSRLDIPAIEAAVASTGAAFADGSLVQEAEEPSNPDLRRRLVEGYRYVDALLADRTDIFGYGHSGCLLEMNHRVLCGLSPERRRQYAAHIAATERRFYDRPDAGMAELHGWYQRHRGRPARSLAAGLVVQVVSHPQLFIEGNSRTAALIASYVLARAGLPPLVLTPDSYARHGQAIDRATGLDRTAFASGISAMLAARRLAEALQETADPRFLREPAALAASPAAGPGP